MNRQRLEQKQYQALSPQQIQFLELLQIPIVSLEKRIEEELEENPSLEEDLQEEEGQASFQNYSYSPKTEYSQVEDKSESLENYLLKQLIDLNLNDEDLFLIKYLINSLDESGFLSRDLYAISSDLLVNNNRTVSEESLKKALEILQNLDPKGVGAKDLQNCLLIQLEKIHPLEKVAYQILSKYYKSFSNKNFELLMRELNISQKKLKAIYDLIEGLKPIPSAGFSKVSRS